MRTLERVSVTAMMAFAVVAGGCRNRGGNDDGTPADLTAEQEAAVDAVVKQLEATAKAAGGLVESYSGLDANGDASVGECPVVTASFGDGVTEVTVDFGESGCESDYYDNDTVSGSVSLTLDRVTRSVEVVYNDLSVDGTTTTGSADLTLTREGNTRTLTGSINLTTTGVGSVSGDLSIVTNLTPRNITVNDADLSIIEEDSDAYAVDVEGIIIDPIGNGNFIPEAGTVTFDLPAAGPDDDAITIVIEFDANSPVDGTVSVTVNGGPPGEYELS